MNWTELYVGIHRYSRTWLNTSIFCAWGTIGGNKFEATKTPVVVRIRIRWLVAYRVLKERIHTIIFILGKYLNQNLYKSYDEDFHVKILRWEKMSLWKMVYIFHAYIYLLFYFGYRSDPGLFCWAEPDPVKKKSDSDHHYV